MLLANAPSTSKGGVRENDEKKSMLCNLSTATHQAREGSGVRRIVTCEYITIPAVGPPRRGGQIGVHLPSRVAAHPSGCASRAFYSFSVSCAGSAFRVRHCNLGSLHRPPAGPKCNKRGTRKRKAKRNETAKVMKRKMPNFWKKVTLQNIRNMVAPKLVMTPDTNDIPTLPKAMRTRSSRSRRMSDASNFSPDATSTSASW
mmetsp:Transcript_83789/g.242315  ORF Transcript_83789/g.242315 Transcript_83789/m.242315 type:complete len:201 (-) Transcript_83789:3253-3855(-)